MCERLALKVFLLRQLQQAEQLFNSPVINNAIPHLAASVIELLSRPEGEEDANAELAQSLSLLVRKNWVKGERQGGYAFYMSTLSLN